MFTENLTVGKKQSESIEFKYQGDSHYIKLNTLLVSQFHFSAIVTEFKNQMHPDINLDIKVKSFEKGSFDVNQLFEISTVSGLFALQNINYLSTLFSAISDFISIKKFLQGRKADKEIDKGDNVEIHINIDGSNNTLTVAKDAFKIYKNNDVVNNAFKQESEILEADEEITGIELKNEKRNKVIFSVPREDFPAMGYPNPYLEDEENEKVKKVSLGVLRWETVPKKGSRWSFIYENRKIHQVLIRDHAFLERILEERLRFGAGDTLLVDLRIKLKKDEYSGMFLEDKFEVLHVHDIIWRDEQGSLF